MNAQAKKIAEERVEILFNQASSESDENLQKRYVSLARSISMKYRLRFKRDYKRRFCQRCSSYLIPGKNLKVRVRNGKVIYTCMSCGKITRIPIKDKKGE